MYGVWSVQSLWAPLFPTELEDTIGFSTSLNQGEAILISPKSMPEPIQYETFRGYVENTVLPFLRSMDSVERFYREITTKQANLTTHTPHSHFCLHLAMGDFDTARKLLERQRNRWFQKDDDYFVEEEIEQIRKLCRLLDDGNYAAIAQQLHDWEASVAEYSNLEDIWEPTPFPFEPGYVEWLRRSHGRLD